MNYRQWKKQYKKIHGYNPPSRQKARRDYRDAMSDIGAAIRKTVEVLTEALVPAIKEVAETARKILQEIPSWVQQMPEDEFLEMLGTVEEKTVRDALIRLRRRGTDAAED